jgi:hypothetical protein
LLNYSFTEKTEFTQHLKEIGTAQLRELEIIQGNTGRGSDAGWKDVSEIVSGLVKRTLQSKIDLFYSFVIIFRGKREQSDFSQNCARAGRNNLGHFAMLVNTDTNVAETNEIQMSGYLAVLEESLARSETDEDESISQVIDDARIFLLLNSLEQIRMLQGQIQ